MSVIFTFPGIGATTYAQGNPEVVDYVYAGQSDDQVIYELEDLVHEGKTVLFPAWPALMTWDDLPSKLRAQGITILAVLPDGDVRHGVAKEEYLKRFADETFARDLANEWDSALAKLDSLDYSHPPCFILAGEHMSGIVSRPLLMPLTATQFDAIMACPDINGVVTRDDTLSMDIPRRFLRGKTAHEVLSNLWRELEQDTLSDDRLQDILVRHGVTETVVMPGSADRLRASWAQGPRAIPAAGMWNIVICPTAERRHPSLETNDLMMAFDREPYGLRKTVEQFCAKFGRALERELRPQAWVAAVATGQDGNGLAANHTRVCSLHLDEIAVALHEFEAVAVRNGDAYNRDMLESLPQEWIGPGAAIAQVRGWTGLQRFTYQTWASEILKENGYVLLPTPVMDRDEPIAAMIRPALETAMHEIGQITSGHLGKSDRELEIPLGLARAGMQRIAETFLRAVDGDITRMEKLGRALRCRRLGEFRKTGLSAVNFKGLDLRGQDFSGIDLRGAIFDGCDLRGANLARCDLSHASFRAADLRDVHAYRTTFHRTDFTGTIVNWAIPPKAVAAGWNPRTAPSPMPSDGDELAWVPDMDATPKTNQDLEPTP